MARFNTSRPQGPVFPKSAPSAYPLFYRTYSRPMENGQRESWERVTRRCVNGLQKLGKLTDEQTEFLYKAQMNLHCLSSGRWLWVGGTEWSEKPENYYGCYNCSSTNLKDWDSFAIMMDLAMQGCGTGAIIIDEFIEQIPTPINQQNVAVVYGIGERWEGKTLQENTETYIDYEANYVRIVVGDSRKGWVDSYRQLLENSSDSGFDSSAPVEVEIDLGYVRPKGQKLVGFGGVSNPAKLPEFYEKIAKLLNKPAKDKRKLTSVECCLLIDEAAIVIVAGSIRRSAGIRQALSTDLEFAKAKDNLWQQDKDGNWFIDPERDALRMANHTRVFMSKPTRAEVLESVTKQFYSGEGAIQYAPEAIARCNVDLLNTYEKRNTFLNTMNTKGVEAAREYLISLDPEMDDYDKEHRMQRYGLNPCAEQVSADFLCNLAEIHLNMISPTNLKAQEKAFQAGGLAVAVLLNHDFVHPRHKAARKSDPIVGVSFTGLFDHFVHKFGVPWLQWWAEGRPDTVEGRQFKEAEAESLYFWSKIAHQAVWDYCDEHGLKRPNRCTSTQPAGCLDVTAVRVFDQGILLMDELVEPGSGDTDSLPLSVRGGIPSTKAIANEPRDLVKVVLKNNRIIRMTPDHRLSVGGQWVRADEMKPGMTVDYSLNQYNKTEDVSLLSINPEHYTREHQYATTGRKGGTLAVEINTPITVNTDLAYLVGLVLGNGCFSEHNYRLRICHGNMEILNKAQSIIQNLFGIKGSICTTEGKAPELSVSSKHLYNWFHLNGLVKGGKSKELDRIPEPIRRSSKESILACFAGIIDTDGCARNNRFSIDCASEKFIRHLQQVGESVGLCFGVSNNTKGTNFQAEKSIWSVSLYKTYSCQESVDVLNKYSYKLQDRPVILSDVVNRYPYEIKDVIFESGTPDYTYDITVEREEDDESWYWQGGIKSHNSKSLLTGASPGWHPPKAQRFIRRITFRKDDPVALACLDMGYSAVPSQSDKDENGKLLDTIADPRCTEWLIEIPTEVTWANLPGADEIDISKFSALAQFDFYMQVQKYYTTFNTSATIEYREHEIEPLANRIYDAIQNDEGYISAALLARFDANETFPRLPFEPINKETYDRLVAEQESKKLYKSFKEALMTHDNRMLMVEAGPAGCDSDKCLLPLAGPPQA